ncbi:polyamine ABC transporter substrate-binding protein [Allostella humosa]|uniref:ABC transporter permease n=1 Tax=Stella humosa TaxID=94 RepID=UPI00113B3C73|nr:polyamine ABC transporter substrate-binding protein [Stella humosa]
MQLSKPALAGRAPPNPARWRAAALVAPLFLFLLVTFLAPIGAMMWRAVGDAEVAPVFPRTLAALQGWDGRALPLEPAFAALVADIRQARTAGTLASVATRLNYDVNGYRSLLFATARRLPAEGAPDMQGALIALNPLWGERENWAALRRAGGPVTDLHLLAALDLRRDADGAIAGQPADQAVFRTVLGRTLWISVVVTLICLGLGYPAAYLLARLPERIANPLLILILVPFWTSLLVRTAAWVVLLQREGVINSVLLGIGLTAEPLPMLYNRFAVYVAMVHILLPFMILPLYSVMRSIPAAHLRAASSLGAAPFTVFRRVFLPQTGAGVAAGCLLVFIQAIGYYVTPALVGGAEDQMVSYFIAFYASRTINWGMAAALSILLVAATAALLLLYRRLAGGQIPRLG